MPGNLKSVNELHMWIEITIKGPFFRTDSTRGSEGTTRLIAQRPIAFEAGGYLNCVSARKLPEIGDILYEFVPRKRNIAFFTPYLQRCKRKFFSL